MALLDTKRTWLKLPSLLSFLSTLREGSLCRNLVRFEPTSHSKLTVTPHFKDVPKL